MVLKKTILACTNDHQLTSRIAAVCEECSLETVFIKNGKELPAIFDTAHITVFLVDAGIQDPCVIDLLNILFNLKCEIPVIILGDCEENVFLAIKRIGSLKKLSMYTMSLDLFDSKLLLETLKQIYEKNPVINDEIITVALEKKQFKMYYQPKIAFKDNKFVGVESLIRLERPNHGLVFPDFFIPIAEESGLIIPVTYWIIHEVFRQYAIWKRKGKVIGFSINLSAKILIDVSLPDEIDKLAREFKVNPHDICFEITESAAMRSPDIVLEVLTRIRLKGFLLSIDDFGTGYSSLVELQRLPFTELKIDKSFVRDLANNDANLHITRSIINLGKNMGLSLVAEGVENREVISILKQSGCDVMQGYFISKPLSESEFISWYEVKIDKNGIYID